MVLNGGCASKEELDALDGYETALLLIDEGNGVITPYGVVYDNGMRLSQLYDGRHFPQYFYEPPLLTLTVQQSKDAPKTWLYLPAPDIHIKRSLVRAGIVDPADMRLSFQGSEFPDAVDCVLDMESECLEELNKLCQAIQQMSTDEIKKLGAVVEYARPETAAQVRQLAENLEQFDYAPGVQNVEEYGRYMIQKSGRFEYDENLCDYYDYARYGLERMNAEEGQVVKSGYRYCLRCTPSPGEYQGYLYSYDLRQQRMAQQAKPVGRITYASGEEQTFTDTQKYLDTIREELPYQATTGFRYETLTDDPAVRKAVDDILLDFAGEENPRRGCNYGLTEAGKQALQEAADPDRPHTYAWFVMTDCNIPGEQIYRGLTLEEAIRTYLDSDRPEKRLGVTKDGIATVDLVRSLNGEQHFFTDHLQLDSFKRDPEIAAAVKTLRLELEQNTPQQGITMGGLS